MSEDKQSNEGVCQLADREVWVKKTLTDISDTRGMVEFWLQELEHYTRGDGHGDEQRERDRRICERTRMVLVAAETLHNLTSIFLRWAGQGSAELAWDIELAARTDELMEAAVNEAQTSPYKDNCAERLEYVRRMWPRWCPDFHPQSAAVG